MPRVLIGPAPARDFEPVYGPLLRDAGFELIWPARQAQMTKAELLAQLPGCDAVLAGSEPYTPAVIAAAAAKGLRVIGRAGVGYDHIHVDTATAHGIPVTIGVGSNHNAVAEHAVLLILGLLRRVLDQDKLTRDGKWPRKAVRPLRGATVGIIGLGRTGSAVAKRLVPFDVTVIGCEPYQPAFAHANGIPLMSADEVFARADIVTLHTPLTDETRHLVNARTLGLMKPGALLINTCRGEVVEEAALVEAIRSNRIGGAGIDVFADEPIPPTHPYCSLPNTILTAHVAGVDHRSIQDMALFAAQAIVKLFRGEWPDDWALNPELKAGWKAIG